MIAVLRDLQRGKSSLRRALLAPPLTDGFTPSLSGCVAVRALARTAPISRIALLRSGKIPRTSLRRRIALFQSFLRIVCADLGQLLGRERGEKPEGCPFLALAR